MSDTASERDRPENEWCLPGAVVSAGVDELREKCFGDRYEDVVTDIFWSMISALSRDDAASLFKQILVVQQSHQADG